MQTITPNLWFDHNAQEAVDFYTGIFPDSAVTRTSHYPTEGLQDFQKDFAGKVLTIDFTLGGQAFTAINAGPEFTHTPAVSFVISCKDQDEIDYYWGKLSADPSFEQCGWLRDRYGVTWQVVPENTYELLQRPGAFEHMAQMTKLVIADF